MDMNRRCFAVNFLNGNTSFINMSTASAPIQATEARVKYWIMREKMVQETGCSVRSMPTRKKNSMKKRAKQS